MGFEQIERKIIRPPAAHNVARLLDPSCELKTTNNIAKFAIGIPSFNYNPALKICIDRVAMSLPLETALKAVKMRGAPAGRDQNASLVEAFYAHDLERGYSQLRMIDNYEGQFKISREISVPTSPTFTVLDKGKQVPVVLCGWKAFSLQRDQVRAWLSMLDSGLFSFADYRHSPWEVVLFPEVEIDGTLERHVEVIQPGQYDLFTSNEMRDLAAMYARAQQAAMPIARELWEAREVRRRKKEIDVSHDGPSDAPSVIRDLFAKDEDDD